MSLQDSLFSEDVEDDVTIFARNKARKRALVFPPVNSYHRYIIHRLVQERFSDLLHTFSIGQGSARRTVVCYKSDLKRDLDPKLNALEWKTTGQADAIGEMGVEGQRSSSTSPEHAPRAPERQARSVPAVEIYRPPAARRSSDHARISEAQIQSTTDRSSIKNLRQRRPDRAVYVPRHRRSLEVEGKRPRNLRAPPVNHTTLNENPNTDNNIKLQDVCCIKQSTRGSGSDNEISEGRDTEVEDNQLSREILKNVLPVDSGKTSNHEAHNVTGRMHKLTKAVEEDAPIISEQREAVAASVEPNLLKSSDKVEVDGEQIERARSTMKDQTVAEHLNSNDAMNRENGENRQLVEQNVVSEALKVISDCTVENKSKYSEQVPVILTSQEKKTRKMERQKSKPAPPPDAPLKINRDECDWDSLFDDNGDCLDPTLIDELTSAIGEVMIECPKNDYKAYSKQVQVSSDEFAHVVEIYDFPSEFKTSDLAAVFSPFRNGGFELKWVDDTHCLGVFSSPLVAAEVLASNHPFVKTRPLSEASVLSKTKARRSAEFLQPYRNRPETCAALARRLVTGALGVKLATARQEREHEKNVLREAKEKRRLANKQREDVWEGIIPEK